MTAAAEHPPRTNVPNERVYRARLLGVNGANPVTEFGAGMVVTRTGEGIYRFTFPTNPGKFVQVGGFAFGDTVAAGVVNKRLARAAYTAPTSSASGYVEIHVFEAAVLDDIEDTEYLDISFVFSEGGT